MSTPTSLTRSIPFWVLIAGSVAAVAAGTWIALSHIGTMTTTLTDGSATGVEVYAGQAWAVLGAVLVGAGLVGLVFALALSAARALLPAPTVVVEPIDWADESVVAVSDETDADLAIADPAVVVAADAADENEQVVVTR